MSILFEPTRIGRYSIPNRILMAPMSRNRAGREGIIPGMTAEYYGQRASAGLIIAEATEINNWSGGMSAPGIFTAGQTAAWAQVTEAVHDKGGRIFLQLWHAGRAAHHSLMPAGRDVAAPSAITLSRRVMTHEGLQKATAPRALALDEILQLRSDFAHAAQNALAAGFDGIEFHGAGGYLIDQFLRDCSNHRDDAYGGSAENRFRFLAEILEDAISIWGADRIGVRLSPTTDFNDMRDSDTLGTFSHIISQLDTLGLAYLHFNERLPWLSSAEEQMPILDKLREQWTGPLIANGNFDAESGAAHIDAGKATVISYGRLFLANPDLPQRFSANAPLNDWDESTFYGGDQQGYTDYPFLEEDIE